eukprot:EG_transcript_1986
MSQRGPTAHHQPDGRRAHSETRAPGHRSALALSAASAHPLAGSGHHAPPPPLAPHADSDPEEGPPGLGPRRRTLVAFDREGIVARVAAENPFRGRACPEVEMPVRPTLLRKQPVAQQLKAVQRYIGALEYNFLSHTFFNTNKHRPLVRIMDTCRDIVKECLPIRCLEATFLAIYLTQELTEVDRIPVAFKTEFGGATYRHIVLLTRHASRWGALGLSRKADLMHKPLTFNSLADILLDFKHAYERYGHAILSLKLGLPVSHDSTNTNTPCWKFFALNPRTTAWAEVEKITANYAAMATKLAAEWETCAAISRRTQKRLQVDGGLCYPLPPIGNAAELHPEVVTGSRTGVPRAASEVEKPPAAEELLQPIPRTRSIITAHLAAAVAAAAALEPTLGQEPGRAVAGEREEELGPSIDPPAPPPAAASPHGADHTLLVPPRAPTEEPPSSPSPPRQDEAVVGGDAQGGSAPDTSRSGSFSRRMSNSAPCRALRAIAAVVDHIEALAAAFQEEDGEPQTPSGMPMCETAGAQATPSDVSTLAPPSSLSADEGSMSDLYDADTAEEGQEEAEAADQLAKMQRLVDELGRQRPRYSGGSPPRSLVAMSPPSTGPGTPMAEPPPASLGSRVDLDPGLCFAVELDSDVGDEEMTEGVAPKPLVLADESTFEDDSAPCPVLAEADDDGGSARKLRAPPPPDPPLPPTPAPHSSTTGPSAADVLDPTGPPPTCAAHVEVSGAKAPAPPPRRSLPPAEHQAEDLSEDEEENRMVLACILMNRSPLRKRFFGGAKARKDPTLTTTTTTTTTTTATIAAPHAGHSGFCAHQKKEGGISISI